MHQPRILPPSRSSLPAVDIPGFLDAVDDAIEVYVKTHGVPEGTTPTFVRAFPKERLTKADDPLHIITARVLKSEMAATTNEGNVPRGPTIREVKDDPRRLGYKIVTLGWWEQVQVEFSVWAKSNDQADILTNWFHVLMMGSVFGYKYFQARGVQNFKFIARQDDDFDPRDGQEIYRRRLCYSFRLETLKAVLVKTLESVTINVRATHDKNDAIESLSLPTASKGPTE